ncbi:MAG: DNA polymerase III subunit chi [Burkholderiales bacterium]|nr:DNA polymerase III subunit chi [Burkholderiales bacterium]
MTTIDFYTQVADKHDFVRRLCARALASRARLVLWAPDRETCQRLSRMLWSVPATSFIAHVAAHDPLAAVTPVILDCEAGTFTHDDVLVNLRAEVPSFFSRFNRLIEIVAAGDETDASAARTRYRFYRDRGYELRTHDMSRAAAAPNVR